MCRMWPPSWPQLKNCSVEEVAQATSANFERLFARTQLRKERSPNFMRINFKMYLYIYL